MILLLKTAHLCFTVHPAMKIGERVNGVEQSIDVDAILELSVDTSGIPSAEITWFLPSGQPLVESKRITIESSNGVSTLTVRDMLPSESGVYTVEAQNGVGKGFADFRVNVQGEHCYMLHRGCYMSAHVLLNLLNELGKLLGKPRIASPFRNEFS